MAPCFLVWRMVPAGPKYSTVIPRSEATWESPGKMFIFAQQIDEWYREIATGLPALAMTAVADGWHKLSEIILIQVRIRAARTLSGFCELSRSIR